MTDKKKPEVVADEDLEAIEGGLYVYTPEVKSDGKEPGADNVPIEVETMKLKRRID